MASLDDVIQALVSCLPDPQAGRSPSNLLHCRLLLAQGLLKENR